MTHDYIDLLHRDILDALGEPLANHERRRIEDLAELIRLAHAGLDARHAALSELVSLSQEMGLYDATETKTAARNSDG